jgi:uncharacterized protein YbjT (DUF2867 family)
VNPASSTVAVAGATGNAGREIVRALADRGARVVALCRAPERLGAVRERCAGVRVVEVTQPRSVAGALDGVDALVSALGKTWQKDKTPRRAVDVDANLHLFAEAKRAGVRRVGLISVAWARADHPVAMMRMKGEVEVALKESGLDFVIIQPSGFFSDMWEMLRMCERGTLWSFGKGRARFNPIALEDLGDFVAESVLDDAMVGRTLPAGGPDAFDMHDLAAMCGRVLGREVRVRAVPMWLAKAAVKAVSPFSRGLWEMADFFVGNSAFAETVGDAAVLPSRGQRHLEDYLRDRYVREGSGATPATR